MLDSLWQHKGAQLFFSKCTDCLGWAWAWVISHCLPDLWIYKVAPLSFLMQTYFCLVFFQECRDGNSKGKTNISWICDNFFNNQIFVLYHLFAVTVWYYMTWRRVFLCLHVHFSCSILCRRMQTFCISRSQADWSLCWAQWWYFRAKGSCRDLRFVWNRFSGLLLT